MADFDPTLPLMTFFRNNPDYDRLDEVEEMGALLQRQELVNKIFTGQASLDELLDCLNDQGFGVDDFIESTEEELEYVQENDLLRFADPSDLEFFAMATQ